jgi:hypothetical protein
VLGGHEVAVDDAAVAELEGLDALQLVGGEDLEAGLEHQHDVLPVEVGEGFNLQHAVLHL